MDTSTKILSDIIAYTKYARYMPELKRRETWEEIVNRNKNMHIRRFPDLKEEIEKVYEYVYRKEVLPSGRSLQFAGKAIEVNNSRIFNCSYLPINHPDAFSEICFLLLSGCGCGYSVQTHHVYQLPSIFRPTRNRGRKKRYLIGDSIEGWSDAIKVLVENYFYKKQEIDFDFRDIRPKGALLITSGGKAPGPEPLRVALVKIKSVFENAIGERGENTKLKPIEVHDILCHIADAVLSGGIRRAAMIAGFSPDDIEMIESKMNSWYELHPERGRANNSAIFYRPETTKKQFDAFWSKVQASGSGEPGIFWTNDKEKEIFTNPCFTGDSMILTPEGEKRFDSFVENQEYKFLNYMGEIVKGVVYTTGVKNIIEIKAGRRKDPKIIKCTPDHRFMTVEGNEIKAKDLKGERLMPFFQQKEIEVSLPLKYGFVFGDGSFRKDSTTHKNIQCSFTPGKDDEVKSLFKRTGWSINETSFTIDVPYNDLERFGIDTSRRTYNRIMPDIKREDQKDFLTGLFSANGCVILSGGRIAFKTTSNDLRDDLMSLLEQIGIKGAYYTTNKSKKISWENGDYESRESYDINIARLEDLITFAQEISFIQTYKRELLENLILSKAPYVFSVKDTGKEKVYDFSLNDETHWGIVNGVVAHNCSEVSLRPFSFCNLTTTNVSDVDTQEELNRRVKAATFLGTLQASYTDFHYLRDIWREVTEKDSLIGVSMTGIGSGKCLGLNLKETAEIVKKENERVASLIGINCAERTTVIKPEGTSSSLLGVSSGIHAWFSPYYIRRIRVGKNESIYKYFSVFNPDYVEDCIFKSSSQAIISLPIKAPKSSIIRNEDEIDLLERAKKWNLDWIRTGHRSGKNFNNVSITVSVRDWNKVGRWLWENRSVYHGVAVLPYDGGNYKQAPFEDCDKKTYEKMLKGLQDIDLSLVVEDEDYTNLQGELACAGGTSCEIIEV